jgi:predicted dehydrogenase
MARPLKAILIGAGNRGERAYGSFALAHPDQIQFVAVAEPREVRRARFAEAHHIPQEGQFQTWEDLLDKGQIADVALICTQDHLHAAPAITAMEAGYDVLLEKPIATSLADCVQLVQTAERTGRLLQVCHVLRYTPFFSTVHDVIASGRLGHVVTVEHRENVSYWHMAHSYVRGNWANSAQASPMILAKCCHDLDLLYWYLGPCTQISSVGSLIHYRPENAPPGAPKRCTDGCPHEDTCPWYAPRLYLDLVPLLRVARDLPKGLERLGATLALDHPALTHVARRLLPPVDEALDYRGWPISVVSEDTSQEARLRALETGPYGRCVYHCDNDVVDHQVVTIEFGAGASAVMVMHGHSHQEGRTMRIDGSWATLRGTFLLNKQEIEVHDHLTGEVEVIEPAAVSARGHGGGDKELMAAFCRAVRDRSCALTTARESLESHLMAFAAEEARIGQQVIHMDAFRQRVEEPGHKGEHC